jgi:hypothetical protein
LPYARAGFSERELRGVIHKALNNNSYGLSGSMGLSRGRESQMETIIKGIHEAVAAKEKNLTITTFGAGVSFNEPVDTLELALQELKKKSHAIKRITLRYYDNNPYILDSISRNLPGEINSFLSKNNKEWIGKINVEVFYADILDIADNLGDHRWRQVVLPSHIMILRHTWILKQGFGEFDETVTQTEPFRVRFKNISEFVNVLWNKIPVGTLIVQESTGMNAGPEINIKKIKYKKDRAMVVKNGGIDLTPANMNLRIQNGGAGIKFYLDPAMLQRLQNAPGFVPVIVNVQPMTDLRQFLGIQEISVDN